MKNTKKMDRLPLELLFYISDFLDFKSIIQFKSINKINRVNIKIYDLSRLSYRTRINNPFI